MPREPKTSSKIDASHALRLREVMETSTETSSSTMLPNTSPNAPQVSHRSPIEHQAAYAAITALTPCENGHAVTVSLSIYLTSADEIVFQEQQCYDIVILMFSCQELSLSCGEISAEQLENLSQAEQLYKAVCQCITYLAYGSMSHRRLYQKLLTKGFDKHMAERAVDYIDKQGYLDEFDTALRFAERGIQKYWGPKRIQSDLFTKGFSADIITEIMESLDETDFEVSCAHLIQTKYGGIPKEAPTRRKLIAYLMRQGYTSEIISQTLKQIQHKGCQN